MLFSEIATYSVPVVALTKSVREPNLVTATVLLNMSRGLLFPVELPQLDHHVAKLVGNGPHPLGRPSEPKPDRVRWYSLSDANMGHKVNIS